MVAIFALKMLSGQQPIINGDGRQTRDYVYAGDVARANLRALEYPECGIFNIPCIMECEATEDERTIAGLSDATAALRDALAIRTYVVGFGSGVSDEELTAIAENGGTVLGDWIPASDVDELAAAFETVLSEMLECNPII